jgi:hypothetical protein
VHGVRWDSAAVLYSAHDARYTFLKLPFRRTVIKAMHAPAVRESGRQYFRGENNYPVCPFYKNDYMYLNLHKNTEIEFECRGRWRRAPPALRLVDRSPAADTTNSDTDRHANWASGRSPQALNYASVTRDRRTAMTDARHRCGENSLVWYCVLGYRGGEYVVNIY